MDIEIKQRARQRGVLERVAGSGFGAQAPRGGYKQFPDQSLSHRFNAGALAICQVGQAAECFFQLILPDHFSLLVQIGNQRKHIKGGQEIHEAGLFFTDDGFHVWHIGAAFSKRQLEVLIQAIDVDQAYARQKERIGPRFPLLGRYLVLSTVDDAWLSHLYTLDDLREGIAWTAYGGTDPLVAFKRESFVLFEEMLASSGQKIVRSLVSPRLAAPQAQAAPPAPRPSPRQVEYVHAGALPSSTSSSSAPAGAEETRPKRTPVVAQARPNRNDPCPCGSGRKYKACCGRNA